MKYSASNKPIVCMQTNSRCYKETRKMKPVGVLWHSTGCNNPWILRYVQPSDNDPNKSALIAKIGINKYGSDWNHNQVDAGLNCWIGKLANGDVATVQTMPWDYRPWGCGSGSKGSCNTGWIQFEICEDNLNDKSYFEKVYQEGCEITAYLCKLYNIDPCGVQVVNGMKVPNILCHHDSYSFGMGSGHVDIDHWFPKYGKSMETVRQDVCKLLGEIYRGIEDNRPVALRKGDCGKWVTDLQTKLNALGFNCGTADGVYGDKTVAGVKSFQKRYGLTIDGIAGQATFKKLDEIFTPGTSAEKKKEEPKPVEQSKPVEQPKVVSNTTFKVGDVVKIVKGAKWLTGSDVPNWCIGANMYVREINGNRVVVSVLKEGAVTGAIDVCNLYKENTAIPFKEYVVRLPNTTNVYAGSNRATGIKAKIKGAFTIIAEADGFGKLKSGLGWIDLKEAVKI